MTQRFVTSFLFCHTFELFGMQLFKNFNVFEVVAIRKCVVQEVLDSKDRNCYLLTLLQDTLYNNLKNHLEEVLQEQQAR